MLESPSSHSGNETPELFLERVDALYEKIKQWLMAIDSSITVTEEDITIEEQPGESYSARVLIVNRPGYETIRFVPKGRWIIGAEGRVDVQSRLGTEALVYVSDAGPVFRAEILTEGGKVLGHESPLAGEVAEGWVFVQNRQLGIFPSLDAFLLERLIEILGN